MHGITSIDRVDGIEQEWHGLTNVREAKYLNSFHGGALDIDLQRVPLWIDADTPATEFILDKGGKEEARALEAIVSGGNVLNVVENGNYGESAPQELFDTIKELIEEFGFQVVSIGTIYGRKRFFVTLENQDSSFDVRDGDSCKNRVCLVGSFDGSLKRRWFNAVYRIVCSNTLNASISALKAMGETEGILNESQRCTKHASKRLGQFAGKVNEWAGNQLALTECLKTLDSQAISTDEALQFSAGLVGGAKLSTRSLNLATDIATRFEDGIGNLGKSRYDLLNGVTEKFTRDASNTPQKAFLSSEFGQGAKVKTEALEILLNDETLEALCLKGEKLLNTYEESKSAKAGELATV
jgi:hypothetical protein